MTKNDLYARNPSRDLEKFAVATVTAWIEDRGAVFDTSDGHDPDFRIEYYDGRLGLGEVGWHEDSAIREMWANTFRRPRHQVIDLHGDAGTWSLGLVAGANIKALYRDLPSFVDELISNGTDRFDVYQQWPRGPVGDTARRLGIEYIARYDPLGESVAIYFMPSQGGALIPADSDAVASWIESVLDDPRYADTTEKLLAREADERHVFLMTGSLTEFGIEELLRRAPDGLPTRQLHVRTGITHVWSMPQFAAPEAFATLWTARGWAAVPLPDPS